MSFVKNVVLAAIAACAVACGGTELEPSPTEQVPPPAGEQQPVDGTGDDGTVSAFGTCTGFDGNNYCLVDCGDGYNYWHVVGHVSSIPYGDCIEAGRRFCIANGWSRLGSCWGYP